MIRRAEIKLICGDEFPPRPEFHLQLRQPLHVEEVDAPDVSGVIVGYHVEHALSEGRHSAAGVERKGILSLVQPHRRCTDAFARALGGGNNRRRAASQEGEF